MHKQAGVSSMKMVIAIIKPFKLDDVRDALAEVGIQGLTITEVKGCGRQKGHTELYRGAEYVVDFVPKMKLELAIKDDQLDTAIDAITADILLLERNARGGQGFASIFDLLDIPGVTPQSLAILSAFLTVRPNTYVVTSRGRDEGTGIEVEIVATIQRTALPVPITSITVR